MIYTYILCRFGQMNKKIEQWIAIYEKKVGKFERDERFSLFYLPDKGFCELTATDNMVVIGQVSGDGRFWKKFAEDVAQRLGLKVCGCYCWRDSTHAWARLFGFKVDRVEGRGGLKRYYGTGKNGGWGMMTEAIFDDGKRHCSVTWEVIPDNEKFSI